MSVGFLANKTAIDSQAGGLVVAVRDSLYRASQFSAWLQSSQQADANLIALGYVQAEVTTLKAAFNDLGGTGNSLYRIAHGQAFVGSSNDFFFNAQLLTGCV
jgi:hypothetical protein